MGRRLFRKGSLDHPEGQGFGLSTIDIAIAHPERFPTAEVKAKVSDVGIEVVTSTTLNKDTNLISPDPKVRAAGVESLKKLVDVNIE